MVAKPSGPRGGRAGANEEGAPTAVASAPRGWAEARGGYFVAIW